MAAREIELSGLMTHDDNPEENSDTIFYAENDNGNDDAGLLKHTDISAKQLAEMQAAKEEARLPFRQRFFNKMKKVLIVVLFVIMLGATSLYVIGPGNENFDEVILLAVSANHSIHQELLPWPRYQVEALVKTAPAVVNDTKMILQIEGQLGCDPAAQWMYLTSQQKNVSMLVQQELEFVVTLENVTDLPLNMCLRAVIRTTSPVTIPISAKIDQFGILVKYEVLLSILLLLWVYFLIAFDIVHRTLAGAIGAFSALGVLAFVRRKLVLREVVTWIDQDTIGLLFGMMTMVEIFSHTGFFEWSAVKAFRLSRGNVRRLVLALCILTGVISSFLDNVTTMLLIGPVSIQLARVLNVDPLPIMLSEVLFSNVGGTATLIGDPPNIIIAEALKLSFGDFIISLAPCVLILLVAMSFYIVLYYRKEFGKTIHLDVAELESQYGIKDKFLLLECSLILGTVVLLFFLEPVLEMQQAWVALLGATVMILVARPHEIDEVLHKIEWSTLLFFMTLFVMLEALSELGLVKFIGTVIGDLITMVPPAGRMYAALNIIVWMSAVLSAFIDNIPYTVTMVAVLEQLAVATELPLRPLAWALALGSCLGGNGTIIGASANVVTSGICETRGFPITFGHWFRVGFPFMLVTVAIASVYLTIVFGAIGFVG